MHDEACSIIAPLYQTGGEMTGKGYLGIAVLLGLLVISSLLAQKDDKSQPAATGQSQKAATTSQSQTKKTTKPLTSPPKHTPKSKKATKGKSQKTAAQTWQPCTLPPKHTQYSFWQTCTNVSLNSCTLQASCQMANGQSRNATFDTNQVPQCPSDWFYGTNLYNNNGYMCCGYAGEKNICGQ